MRFLVFCLCLSVSFLLRTVSLPRPCPELLLGRSVSPLSPPRRPSLDVSKRSSSTPRRCRDLVHWTRLPPPIVPFMNPTGVPDPLRAWYDARGSWDGSLSIPRDDR